MQKLMNSWPLYIAACSVALTLVFASIGPAATDGVRFLESLVFWGAHISLALILLSVCQVAVSLVRVFSGKPALVQITIAGLLGVLFFAPIAIVLDQLFATVFGTDLDEHSGIAALLLEELSNYVVPMLLCWYLVNAPKLIEVASDQKVSSSAAHEENSTSAPSESEDAEIEIPLELRVHVVAMSAELHYLRVYTASSDKLILFNFGHAIDAFGERRGMQIHRSHWISLDHVKEIRRDGSRMVCEMDNGLVLPVSRPYRSELRRQIGENQ